MRENKKGFSKSICMNGVHNKGMKYSYSKFNENSTFIYKVVPKENGTYRVVVDEKILPEDERFEKLVKPIESYRFKMGWETWVIVEEFADEFKNANDAMDFINNKYF